MPHPESAPRSDTPRARQGFHPHRQGLLGVLLALAVVGIMLLVLHLRRNGLPVDDTELSLARTTPCMSAAIARASAGGHVITYAELDRLQKGCGQ